MFLFSTDGGWRSIGIEIVNEHGWVFHHTLCGEHEPGFHRVHEAVGGPPHVVQFVAVVAVWTTALISKLARDFRVHKQALLPIAALGEEFTFVSWVHILALRLRLVTLWPVLASNLNFLLLRFQRTITILTVIQISHDWCNWLYRTESLKTFSL